MQCGAEFFCLVNLIIGNWNDFVAKMTLRLFADSEFCCTLGAGVYKTYQKQQLAQHHYVPDIQENDSSFICPRGLWVPAVTNTPYSYICSYGYAETLNDWNDSQMCKDECCINRVPNNNDRATMALDN